MGQVTVVPGTIETFDPTVGLATWIERFAGVEVYHRG